MDVMASRILLIGFCLAFSGCSTLRQSNVETDAIIPNREAVNRVVVDGLVRKPGSFSHDNQLTLGKAISLAGGRRLTEDDVNPLMISLEKGRGISRQRILMPYDYVMTSDASQILLSPDDAITVVSKFDTLLEKENNNPRWIRLDEKIKENPVLNQFIIGGAVKAPSAVNLASLKRDRRISEVVNLSVAVNEAKPIDIFRHDLAVFSRPQPRGVGKPDIFVIPYNLDLTRVNALRSDAESNTTETEDDTPANTTGSIEEAREYANKKENLNVANKTSSDDEVEKAKTWGQAIEVLPTDKIVVTSTYSLPMIRNGLLRPLVQDMMPRIEELQTVESSVTTPRSRFQSRLKSTNARFRNLLVR